MSRSGYLDDIDSWSMIRWRGVVASAIRGRRGQAMLVELLAALDAMPVKELIKEALVEENGEVCALGALGRARGTDMSALDPKNYAAVANAFGVASALAQEIAWMNDERVWKEATAQRWERMRGWVAAQIKQRRTDA